MPALGRCPNLTTIQAPNIVNSGSFTGTWAAASDVEGTFTVAIAASPDCSGGATAAGSAIATLKMNGCGRLRVTIGGKGCRSFETPSAFIRQRKGLPTLGPSIQHLNARGPAGGSGSGTALCPQEGDMVPVSPHTSLEADFRVRCGDVISLNVVSLLHTYCGARNVTIKVEVIP